MNDASDTTEPSKPRLRGYIHQEAFFFALGAGLLLILRAKSPLAQLSCSIYTVCLLTMFGVSATYHRIQWQPRARRLMKRLDHSAIFISIAGTMTPFVLLAVPETSQAKLISLVWLVALAGVLQSTIWIGAPKWFGAVLYVIAGWTLFPYLGDMAHAMGSQGIALIISGGLVYSLGAVVYALKAPRLFPKTFGYHELFHLLTIIAATLHFIAVYRLTAA